MSREKTITVNYPKFAFPWLIMFVVIKAGGTTLASWSWWWLLLPIVPDLVFIFHKLGWAL